MAHTLEPFNREKKIITFQRPQKSYYHLRLKYDIWKVSPRMIILGLKKPAERRVGEGLVEVKINPSLDIIGNEIGYHCSRDNTVARLQK